MPWSMTTRVQPNNRWGDQCDRCERRGAVTGLWLRAAGAGTQCAPAGGWWALRRLWAAPHFTVGRLGCTAVGICTVTAYTYLWEFIVEPEHLDEFQRHYGSQGSWVQLFRQAPGYIETLLLQDSTNPHRFITLDRWNNDAAYRKFRSEFSQQYAALDSRCEKLTIRETLIGEFSEPTV